MENEHVVFGLIRKRAELAGEIDHLESQIREKLVALQNLDGTIRIFQPDIDLTEIKPRPIPIRAQAAPGEMIRAVLTVLRQAREPISSHETTLRVMALRTMNVSDAMLVRTVSKRVFACLRHNRHKGLLRSIETDGQALLWEVAR